MTFGHIYLPFYFLKNFFAPKIAQNGNRLPFLVTLVESQVCFFTNGSVLMNGDKELICLIEAYWGHWFFLLLWPKFVASS